MNNFFQIYITCWVSASIIALIVFLADNKSFAFANQKYWQFILKPWKVITFILATTSLTIVAPYTDDPTWDYFDSLFMSFLTYGTAPWTVGVLFKTIKKELPLKQTYVAICIWLFSASWSYDLYILLRDGAYPMTWFSNIFASSSLYLSAGLLWNLDWNRRKGAYFSFMNKDWPNPTSHTTFNKIILFAIPFMLIVALMLLFFLYY